MKTKLFAIAKITRASGFKGEVGVRPLIRQFDDYVAKPLFIGFDESLATDVKLEKVTGNNNKADAKIAGITPAELIFNGK